MAFLPFLKVYSQSSSETLLNYGDPQGTLRIFPIIFRIKGWLVTKRWKQSSPFKQLSETPFLIIKMCTGFSTDVIWVNTKFCSVTSEPTHSSSRCVSSFKDSLALRGMEEQSF